MRRLKEPPRQIVVLVCANRIMSEYRGREAHRTIVWRRTEERAFSSYWPLLYSGARESIALRFTGLRMNARGAGCRSRPGNRGSALHADFGSAGRVVGPHSCTHRHNLLDGKKSIHRVAAQLLAAEHGRNLIQFFLASCHLEGIRRSFENTSSSRFHKPLRLSARASAAAATLPSSDSSESKLSTFRIFYTPPNMLSLLWGRPEGGVLRKEPVATTNSSLHANLATAR